jgi:hypothetical protein
VTVKEITAPIGAQGRSSSHMSQQGKKEELDQDRSVIDTFMPEHLLRTI